MNKKTQIFMFDLIFSVVIIVVSLGIVANYFTNTSYNVDIYDLNYQILNGFTQTKINTLNDQNIRNMFINNEIKNVDNTVAQQVSEFYHDGNISLAKELTKVFVKDYISREMNFNLTLTNGSNTVVLFSEINTNNNFSNAQISSFSSRQILGFENSTNYFGPYEFDVRIWI